MSSLPTVRLAEPAADPLAGCSDEQRRQAGGRLALVLGFQNTLNDFAAAGRTKAEAVSTFLVKHQPSPLDKDAVALSRPTLYRWLQAYRERGIVGLLDGRSNGVRRAAAGESPRDYEAGWAFFCRLYNAMPPQTVTTCYLMTEAEAEKHGWYWPSLRTIQARAADPSFQIYGTYWRLGPKEWTRRYGKKIPRPYAQYRSGEWPMGDGHPIDVFCRRSESDPTILRPVLVALLDIRSRCLAWHICEVENQRNVMICCRRWIERYGVPWHMTIDNGKHYRAKGVSGGRPARMGKADQVFDESYVRSALGQLGIAPHFSLPYNANGKANVERFFGTVETQCFRLFDSWCGHAQDDVFRNADRIAREHPEQCPTLDELRAAMQRWDGIYHAAPHGGVEMEGLSPDAAWLHFNPIPKAVAADGVLDVLCMLTAEAKVTNMGVRYRGILYQNYPELWKLQGQKVLLRIPEDAADWVMVCELDGKPICKAVNERLANAQATHDHVAEATKEGRRVQRLAKQIAQQPMTGTSLVDRALAARAREGKRTRQTARATGTDDAAAAPRNIRPIRSDLAESVRRYANKILPPPAPDAERITAADLDSFAAPPREDISVSVEDLL